MILLLAQLLLVPVQAQTAQAPATDAAEKEAKVEASCNKYCGSAQPEVDPRVMQALARGVSVDFSYSCSADKDVAARHVGMCVEAALCTCLSNAVNGLASKITDGKETRFAGLEQHVKATIISKLRVNDTLDIVSQQMYRAFYDRLKTDEKARVLYTLKTQGGMNISQEDADKYYTPNEGSARLTWLPTHLGCQRDRVTGECGVADECRAPDSAIDVKLAKYSDKAKAKMKDDIEQNGIGTVFKANAEVGN